VQTSNLEILTKPATNERSRLMEIWRRALTMDDVSDPKEVVVAELAEYFKLPKDEVYKRCVNWEDYSVEEWQAKDRSTAEGLLDFYQTQTSWVFDTMWYHAQQYYNEKAPETVEIALGLPKMTPGHHLDFGAGPGSSSLFYRELGWQVSLADISTTMLDFAKWRFQKHNVPATFYDTSKDSLPANTYNLITAFDVMVHVPNVSETLEQLHRALKPGGYLVFNIDNLPKTPKTEWHLYRDQYPILGKVRRVGFRRHPKITYFHVYQKVERGMLGTKAITVYDTLRYNRYVTFVGNIVRAAKRRIQG
jgi:2-polyprenyl-3-methyl-5-hydroxy-6-metoxy-1,4-benzoquinol methylase